MAVAQQAEVDLQLALLAVAAVAVAGQRAGRALEVGRAQVEQHDTALGEVAAGQLALDALLALQQPVHGGVQVLGAGVAQAEVVGQAGGVPPAGGGELGLGAQDAGGDHGADEVALGGWLGSEEAGEIKAAERLQHGQDGAVGARADDLEAVGGVAEGLAGQMGPEQVDGGIGEVGEIGKGLFLDPA